MVNELNVKEKMPTSGSVKKLLSSCMDMELMERILFSLSDALSEQLPDCFLPRQMLPESVEHPLWI